MSEFSEGRGNELGKWTSSHTLSAGDVFRARVILAGS
jgi:hypothetical protein